MLQTRSKTRTAAEIYQLIDSRRREEAQPIDSSSSSEYDHENAVSENNSKEDVDNIDAEREMEASSDDDMAQEAQRAKKPRTTST